MKKDIILPNKWSQDERLKICERFIKSMSDLTDALGFMVIIKGTDDPRHRQAGIKARRQGFDLPSVLTQTQLVRKDCDELLEKLGCENKETT